MRWRPFTWLLLSGFFFVAALLSWQLGDRYALKKAAERRQASPPTSAAPAAAPQGHHASATAAAFSLLSSAGTLNSVPSGPRPAPADHRFPYRLSNTSQKLKQLAGNKRAILLENAFLDTSRPLDQLPIPEFLHSKEPGSYIVQAKSLESGSQVKAFRDLLETAGATVVAPIPNNAYLVRASQAVADRLSADQQTQNVLPFEPYYKLKDSLLQMAIEQTRMPEDAALNLLLFADARDTTLAELQKLEVAVLSEDRSPFGPVLKVKPPLDSLAALARMSGVQEIEVAHGRIPANDLSRMTIGVAADTITTSNYLNLTGTNILININDTGVDTNHPDLKPRVFFDFPISGVDSNGHGTHVAGTIAGTGLKSGTLTNVSGSIMPGTNSQFRGMAPDANLFSMLYSNRDTYLQETAAKTNAFISNNSWNYGAAGYDVAAASYDAAVRDALPLVPGSHPLLYVFSAGNAGNGDDSGGNGNPDSILSPATAKNVITVGAIEQPRNITNNVWKCTQSGTNSLCDTNQPWQAMTDSSDQVASFSSRGNVGVGTEGDSGRFKPDVVAPGTFVVSDRSTEWDQGAYYNATSHLHQVFTNISLLPNALWENLIFVPANAVQLDIRVVPNSHSPVPFPTKLPIYIRQSDYPTTNTYDFVTTKDSATLPGDGALTPVDAFWFYAVGNNTTQAVAFDVITDIALTNDQGNFFEVLSNMNDSLGSAPWYRYESGTSHAAADVSGTLALMQQFFEQRLARTNSPALMKALLISGARSLETFPDFRVNSPLNLQGWGLINLPNSLPGVLSNLTASVGPPASSSMYLFDQSPANALATGQSHTYRLTLTNNAQFYDLRFTLVWTDPPGNPVASIKLVNDLDLIVTNLDTGDIYFGNDILTGKDYNLPWDTNIVPNIDHINNVENIHMSSSLMLLSTNYTVTVVGRHVNANAVTAHTNDVVQDYALVISSGNAEVPDGLQLTDGGPTATVTQPFVSPMTNTFGANGDTHDLGGILNQQHVGANTPLQGINTVPLGVGNGVITLGMTNQWHFYVLTNNTDFTNAAFLTFLPPTLSVPRMGVTNDADPNNVARPEADIDLYVSTNSSLTNLDPIAVENAYKSLGRGGSETIVLSNVTRGVFFFGVKSEDQQAAEYSILGIVSEFPFGSTDNQGNQMLRGFPVPYPIPDGTAEHPQGVTVVAVAPTPTFLHRVVVTNVIGHQLIGDLLGVLTANSTPVVLNNHSTNLTFFNQLTYDDSDQQDVPGAHRSDGPGSLHDFAGKQSGQQWLLTEVDNAAGHVGTVSNLTIWLEKQQDLTRGVTFTLPPGACREDFVEVPADATNLTIFASIQSGTGAISVDLCPLNSTLGCKTSSFTNPPTLGGSVSLDIFDNPPLVPGVYSVRVCNLGQTPVTVHVLAVIIRSPGTISLSVPNAAGPIQILDDSVTNSTITISNHLRIASLDVSMRINDPRISDLALTLIAPDGTRILLFQDRGNVSTNGLGTFTVDTNGLATSGVLTNGFGWTNLVPFFSSDFERAPIGTYGPGSIFEGWTVLSNLVDVVPDYTVPWLENNLLVLNYGIVSNSLPTTNSTNYRLTFKVNHAPYIVGMVGWWPFDTDGSPLTDGSDIFGAHHGLMYGDVGSAPTGKVNQAFLGDGVAARMIVPRAPELDLGRERGLTIEGWINPSTNPPLARIYSAQGDFSTINNTNGAWQYGWSSNLLSKVVPYTSESNLSINGGSEAVWYDPTISVGYKPSVAFSTNGIIVVGFPIAPSTLLLEPGGTNAPYSHVRWTAPQNGWYHVDSQFYAQEDGIDVDVHVLVKGAPVFDATIITNGVATNFVRSFLLAANDTIDFTVGPDTNLVLHAGNTGLKALIQQVGSTNIALAPLVEWVCPIRQPAAGQFPRSALDWYNLGANSNGVYTIAPDGQNPIIIPCLMTVAGGGWTELNATVANSVLNTDTNRLREYLYFKNGLYYRTPVSRLTWNWTNGFGKDLFGTYFYSNTNGGESSFVITNNPNLTDEHQYYGVGASSGSGVYPKCFIWSGYANFKDANNAQVDVCQDFPGIFGTAPASQCVSGVTVYIREVADQILTQGVQLWVSGLGDNTNDIPGALMANIWDTNQQPHILASAPYAITNGGWQHVALTYDTNSGVAVLYTNGFPAVSNKFTPPFIPLTSGDLYFGYHPPTNVRSNLLAFKGGLDEFSVYSRALAAGEITNIFNTTTNGKYGTNALQWPVAIQVTLTTNTLTTNTFSFITTFTNGLTWTNGPHWETNTLDFTSTLVFPGTNAVATNFTGIVLTPLDPNVSVDDFQLSAVLTNSTDGLLHFTENTNVAIIPIKFGSAPYLLTNIPPVLVFSNDLATAKPGVYDPTNNPVLAGNTNLIAGFGPRNWTNVLGSVIVVSNADVNPRATNFLVLSEGAVETALATVPGNRYQLTYSVRGPAAVGWWNGAQDPLSYRALDLIGGNDGAFINGATNTTGTIFSTQNKYVGNQGLYFRGMISNTVNFAPAISSKIELGDPENLRLTNALTIEGWIRPQLQTNAFFFSLDPEKPRAIEQIFFRGDLRDNREPYWFGFEYDFDNGPELMFHVEGENSPTGGYTIESLNFIGLFDFQWHHVAAVFESNVQWTNNPPWPTNELRLYVDGVRQTNITSDLGIESRVTGWTREFPFRDLDTNYSPGVTIGDRNRSDATQPYRGFLDELTVYARALTDVEIAGIYNGGINGKADPGVPPALSLAKVAASIDKVQFDLGNGDNAQWTTRSFIFTAQHTNAVLQLKGLLPGTLVDNVTLTQLPSELSYLPEQSLATLNGMDAFGNWTLEIWDTRTGLNVTTNNLDGLLQTWQLNFQLVPSNFPPVVFLEHGISYTNTLVAHGIQDFVVQVPQWATNATNVLLMAQDRAGNPRILGVLCDTNGFPTTTNNALFWPPTNAPLTNILSSTNVSPPTIPQLNPGQPYYLTVTNPNAVSVQFALGVWFDILTLTNCQYETNFVGPAGIPRYFQFDVPTNNLTPYLPPQNVNLWLHGANSNLTVVMSEHLPLPDLRHFDYISGQPSTNQELVMVVTNSTPFNLQTNRWYVGIFNTTVTNVPFAIESCWVTNYPVLIPLTNDVAYDANLTVNTNFIASPGPPRQFFFEFQVTNDVSALLFEMYHLDGQADLVLQRDVPPAIAPYWAISAYPYLTNEQIVLRKTSELSDLRGNWFLGLLNNEATNVSYTLHAVTNNAAGALVSLVPLSPTVSPLTNGFVLLRWNSVVGETYEISYSDTLPSGAGTVYSDWVATTPFSAIAVPLHTYYRVCQIGTGNCKPVAPPLAILNASVNGSLATFGGSGGTPGKIYYVLTTTNLALPLSSWTRIATNAFDGSGSFDFTVSVNQQVRGQFYRIQVP
jgi:subtilisin-like proprotein convertase family protein